MSNRDDLGAIAPNPLDVVCGWCGREVALTQMHRHTMYVDGANVGEGRIELTEPIGFGAVYTDVGRAALSPVTDDYAPGEADFTGTIKWVQLESGDDSHDHLIDPAMVIHAAMYRQ